jgi:Alpha/beta hydrolase domain containing 18
VRADDHSGAQGLPARIDPSELQCTARVAVSTSAAADILLRTALSAVLSAPMLSWVRPGNLRRERTHLAFYGELTGARDPHAVFAAPADGVPVQARAASRPLFAAPGAEVEMLSFESPFTALNPAVRESYASFEQNRVAWAQRWRHGAEPRPTLCVIHGFGASSYWLNSMFFNLPWLFAHGYDVLLYVLPFHGVRQPRAVPFSGWGLFAHGFAHFNEAIFQGVYDLRVLIGHLGAEGVEQVGVTGLSLGGYTAALLAEVDDRIALSVPNAPVADMASLIQHWFPSNLLVAAGTSVAGIEREELRRALAVHSPLSYPPLIPPERRMIIGGLGDRLAPPEQAEMLCRHWDGCRLHWFAGNHVLHWGRGVYQREMLEFMQQAGFAASAA